MNKDEKRNIVSISPKGIARNNPFGNEGQLEDLMNMRYKDGALRPVQLGNKYTDKPTEYSKIVIHTVNDRKNWIGYAPPLGDNVGYIAMFNPFNVVENSNLLMMISGESLVDMKGFRNYLIITTTRRMYRYLFFEGDYITMDNISDIKVSLSAYDNEDIEWPVATETTAHNSAYTENNYSAAEELKGFIYKKLNEESEDNGALSGAISWIAAYKLSDGTYIKQTTPTIQQNYSQDHYGDNNGVDSWHVRGYGTTGQSPDNYAVAFSSEKWKVLINPMNYANMGNEEKIITSICIFFSKPILKYDIEKTITDEFLSNTVVGNNPFSAANQITEDWGSIGSPELGWFLVAEIPFLQIMQAAGKGETSLDTVDYMNLDNFYQNYATREALPVDQYTHHSINAQSLFIYNSRLWLAGLSRTLCAPQPLIRMMTEANTDITLTEITAKLAVRLNIDGEKRTVVSESFQMNSVLDGASICTIQFPIIAYPDDRAYEFSIYLLHDAVWKEFCTFNLIKSSTHNYSYYLPMRTGNVGYTPLTMILWYKTMKLSTLPVVDDPAGQIYNIDSSQINQIQLSALNNPFSYPSAFNYQVGSGTVNYFAVTVDALSEGQFGQFPVICFTTEGIYALELGTGPIVVSSVTPVSPDVATSVPLSSSKGIFFTDGHRILSLQGRNVQDISLPLRGQLSSLITRDNPHFLNYSNNSQIVQLLLQIATKSTFADILSKVNLAYDHVNKRIVVSNPYVNDSYIFDLETNLWYRISETYEYFVTTTSKLYGVNSRGVIDISDLSDTSVPIQVHFHTKALNFNVNSRKKLEQSLMRCSLKLNTSRYASFCVFASNDGLTWQLITGNDRKTGYVNDIQLTYSHASFKFFIFSFWGELDGEFDNYIDGIDTEAKVRYSHRLRS